MERVAVLALVAVIAACAPDGVSPPDENARAAKGTASSTASTALEPNAILGAWRIVSIEGAVPRSVGGDGGGQRTPRIIFSSSGYGGTTGCNFFGGLGLLEGDRYYAAPGAQTAMGCGELSAQEDAVTGMFHRGPKMSITAEGEIRLTSGARSMALRRDPALAKPEPPGIAKADAPLLAGTSWRINSIDGQDLRTPGQAASSTLRFESEGWSGSVACATLHGGWRQARDRIVPTERMTTTEQLCPPEQAALDDRLGALMRSKPRFVIGPNGEVLIAGGGHWLVGERSRSALADDGPLLAGGWRIISIDGAAPATGTTPSLVFGAAGYSGQTGCNSIQGLFLAHDRRLFTAPGPQTEQGCGELAAQEERINRVLAASPRIALTGENGLALVDRSGSLQLRRGGAAGNHPPPGAAPWTGAPFRAGMIMLDGTPMRTHRDLASLHRRPLGGGRRLHEDGRRLATPGQDLRASHRHAPERTEDVRTGSGQPASGAVQRVCTRDRRA